MRLERRVLALAIALVMLVAAFALAACGGDDEGATTPAQGRAGGTVNILGSSYPDFLDPGLSYTVDGWEVLSQVYPGLLTYKHVTGPDGATVVPGLAEDLPTISADRKTYEFTLREGLKFSDGTAVKASDFKHSIERLLEMDSQGAGLGYTNIVGAADFLKTKKGGVPGIVVDDAARTVTIKLEQPRGAFSYELAIPFAGIVPSKTPAKNQTKSPPAGAGRYMFKPGSVVVNRAYVLVKNPNFSASLEGTAVDAGKVDQISVRIERSLANQATLISQNRADFMIDIPPADRVPELKSRFASRFREFPTNSTFYFFLNSEVPPFNNLKARQAANHAVDINAINRIQGGVLAPAHTILPPGVPGYDGSEPDLYPFDLEKAKQLVEESGTKGMEITVWGNPEIPTRPTVEYWADTLNKIGYKAKVRIIPAETYFTTIGDRKTKVQTGWANWFQDYPHPADFIDVLLNPDRVVATGNNNYSYNAKDKRLATMINALNNEPELTDDVKQRWAEVDRYVQQQAYWAIYGNRKQTSFMSDRIDFQNCRGEHPVWTHDWAEFCLKSAT